MRIAGDAMTGRIILNAAAPEGLRIYAVGDVHGRADLLTQLAGLIEADLRVGACDEAVTVFLQPQQHAC